MAKKKIRNKITHPNSLFVQNTLNVEQDLKKDENKVLVQILKPHNFFTIVAFIFGCCFLLTTPPFQVADEISHFGRAYKLSEIETTQKNENGVSGGSLPKSIGELSGQFRYLCWQPQNKTSLQQIKRALKVPLNPELQNFERIDAGNYFYFSYLPQIPAILFGRLIEINTLYILYLGRFFALIFYIICVRQAINKIPTGKYLLMTITLMPMCLAQAASFNADCTVFSLAFLFLGLIIKKAFDRDSFKIDFDFWIIIVISLLFGIFKPVYLPLAALIFIVPSLYYKRNRNMLFYAGITILISSSFTLLWRSVLSNISSSALSKSDFSPVSTIIGEGSGKIRNLINSPEIVIDLFKNTFKYFGEMYYKSTIGILGYLDTALPDRIYTIFAILILVLSIIDANKDYNLKLFQRTLFFSISTGIVFLTILAMYSFNREEAGLIAEGVQGRYFIPVLFPWFVSFNGIIPWKLNFFDNQYLTAILYIILVYLLFVTEETLLFRYFG